MIENRDIIVFCGDWNKFPSNVQHIVEILARRNRVLWVSGVGLRKPRLQLNDLKRIFEKTRKIVTQHLPSSSSSPVVEFHPFIVPYYDTRIIRSMNNRMVHSAIKAKMKELHFRDPILLPTTPVVSGVVGTLGETSSHYICVDDYSQFEGSYRSVPEMEAEMLSKVDSCFAVSENLMRTRKPQRGSCYYLPQGVDAEHFESGLGMVPAEFDKIPKPIVGFFGLIAPWIDLNLIVRCAHVYPEASFVLIGRPSTDISALKEAKNVYFLGEVSYKLLPTYAQSFNVGLIPFIMNDLTVAANPLKLLEYFSLGIPVVSTDLPEVRKFKDFVNIAESKERFIDLIGKALQDTSQEKKDARRNLAQQFSWDSITEHVSEIIDRIDAEKRSRHSTSTVGANV